MARHQYGPHDPNGNPTTIPVAGPGKYPEFHPHPVPARILNQRAQINNTAHADTQETP